MVTKRKNQKKKTFYSKRKICRFCANKEQTISYKDYSTLRHFVSERGKIIPRRISGNCAKHQREITRAIKRARVMAIMPFTVSGA
ncbi:MAG: 30S ribosomal protein S18 [Desulfobacterota bacterium]|nr:30S ribosomal protein S18 [Thermodesulfobacteriota bacterium]